MLLLKENEPISCLFSKLGALSYRYMCVKTHICTLTCMCIYVYTYIYMYIFRWMFLQRKQKKILDM